MKFTKMHGAGHDYVIVDSFGERGPRNPHGLALEVSDRLRGIGARGLIVVERSDTAHARMQIYNGSGNESPTCTHGLRCVAKYLFDRKLVDSNERLQIESMGQTHYVDVVSQSAVAQFLRVDMGPPLLGAAQIPTLLTADPTHGNRVVNVPLDLGGHSIRVTCVSLQTPHCVVFVEEMNDELVTKIGPMVEFADDFPQQTSVEFVRIRSSESLQLRTWGRAEGELPASVEGACAALVAGVLNQRTARKVTIELSGGRLDVEWDEPSNHVFVTGSAVEVFSGHWNGLS